MVQELDRLEEKMKGKMAEEEQQLRAKIKQLSGQHSRSSASVETMRQQVAPRFLRYHMSLLGIETRGGTLSLSLSLRASLDARPSPRPEPTVAVAVLALYSCAAGSLFSLGALGALGAARGMALGAALRWWTSWRSATCTRRK